MLLLLGATRADLDKQDAHLLKALPSLEQITQLQHSDPDLRRVAFHDKYVKNATPATWKEHLKTLKQKEHDPPPKKGVAARMRSAPTGKALRGSEQEPMPQPASAKNARAARLAKRSGSPSVGTVTEKQKQGVLLLIRATQALYDTVGASGYLRREGKIATFPF